MKNQCILLLLSMFFINFGYSQNSVDGSFEFQTDPAKKYSLYIPSDYDENTPHPIMLGLHPFNTNRWDAQSWRDTLIQFAETNNLLFICPDGGVDGQIDSPIDTAFTTTLLDSVKVWYNVDNDQKYMMGFSWGGKTTYTYGLRRTERFKGFMVIGAAVTIGEVNDIINSANGEAFYLIHGSLDNPNVRYFPILEALQENDACVESSYLDGVGHTIDFENRNAILSEGFDWLRDISCVPTSSTTVTTTLESLRIYPNPVHNSINVESEEGGIFSLISSGGRIIYQEYFSPGFRSINMSHLSKGIYFYYWDGSKPINGRIVKL